MSVTRRISDTFAAAFVPEGGAGAAELDALPGPSPESQRAEALYRATLPVFVNSFDQLTYLRDTLGWFFRHGFENVTVLDQDSRYPPLLAYFRSAEFRARARLVRLGRNAGPRLALDGLPVVAETVPYIFTDPDLGLPEPPDALFVTRLFGLSRRHRVYRVGLALDISDADGFADRTMTDSDGAARGVVEWERRFWETPLGGGVYLAPVDTTFHLFNPNPGLSRRNWRRHLFGGPPPLGDSRIGRRRHAIRVAGPGFLARHRPWYRDDGQTAGERDHYRRTGDAWSNWTA